MQEYSYELRIPEERVAVLIGKSGEVKREIESMTKTKLEIDSKEGVITITGMDALMLFSAREIIRAIGRGFNPDVALLLLKQDFGFELVNLASYARNKNDLVRLRGRVIGEDGKCRNTIENLAGVSLSVYGKTVGIIGRIEVLATARKAIEMIIEGSMHSAVYKMLERRRREGGF